MHFQTVFKCLGLSEGQRESECGAFREESVGLSPAILWPPAQKNRDVAFLFFLCCRR